MERHDGIGLAVQSDRVQQYHKEGTGLESLGQEIKRKTKWRGVRENDVGRSGKTLTQIKKIALDRVCLFGFLTSSSTTRLYRGWATRQSV